MCGRIGRNVTMFLGVSAGDEEQRIFTDFHYNIKVSLNEMENVKAMAAAAAVFGNRQCSPT